jgi:KDO2-lipid IV(A) lauroyltransferase
MRKLQYAIIRRTADYLAKGGYSGITRWGKRLGKLMWVALPGRRRMAVQAIISHLGLQDGQAREIARQSFIHSARSFMEILLVPGFRSDSPLLGFSDPDQFKWLQKNSCPLICTSAHLGAWELLAGMLGDFGPSGTRNMVVVRQHDNPAVWRFIIDQRSGRGMDVIGHRRSAPRILRILKQNGRIGFLVDHNPHRDEAIFLPFLGKIAGVNIGPAVLAVRAKALVWPAFVIRQDEDNPKYILHTEPWLDCAALTGSYEERVRFVAEFYTRAVERAVRKYPQQWLWMHKRWKTQPK